MPLKRCPWNTDNPLMLAYHDTEWGVPQHDDARLFEYLMLDGMQAGLSWQIILTKRESMRSAYHHFDARRIARYGDQDVDRLLANTGVIRNRTKILAVIQNARKFIQVAEEFGTFDRYIWQFVGGKPIRHRFKTLAEIPATSAESDAMSKDLQGRGFKFVGSTICYAFMQGVGMVNDHTVDCFRYRELSSAQKAKTV